MELGRFSPVVAAVILAACASSSTPAAAPAGATSAPVGAAPEKRDNAILYTAVPLARYALESRDSLAMEMPDGSFQRTLTEKTTYLTISMTAAGTGLAVTMVLDSMRLAYPDQLIQQLVDSAVGTRWQGSIAPTGEVVSLEPNHPSVFGEQVTTSLRRLWPVLPPSGAKPGEQWSDSSTMRLAIVSGLGVEERRNTTYRAEKF